MTPALYPAILSTGWFTLDSGENVFQQPSPTSTTRRRQGLQTSFSEYGCSSALVLPTQRLTGPNGGGIVGGSMAEKKWLHGFFVNAIAIPVTGKATVLLSALRPSRRPKRVRAPARKVRWLPAASQTLCLPHPRVGKTVSPAVCCRRSQLIYRTAARRSNFIFPAYSFTL